MDMTPSLSNTALTPAAARVAVERLRSWLPAGAVALRGDVPSALLQGLRQTGMTLQDGGHGAASGVIVLEQGDVGHASERISALLSDIAGPVCLVIVGDAASTSSRAAWEAAIIKAEWRKHPLNERVAPYGELDRVTGLLMIAFERVPAAALAVYPLKALEEERDLHTDMTREPGRRSDAHMTRYAQAAQFIRPGDRVIDVACGLGYGSYQLAHNSHAASFIGLDASEYAVDYANANFAPVSPVPTTFVVGDAQDLTEMADGSADFAVSVETLEHLPEPDRLLSELHRVLSARGRVYASVPNDWSDETGEDPNPFHFHVYDWPRLVAQFERNGFEIEKAWLQDAGGGQKRHLVARSMLEIDPLQGPVCDGEWLLVLARKAGAFSEGVSCPLQEIQVLIAEGRRGDALDRLDAMHGGEDALLRGASHALSAILNVVDGNDEQARVHWQHVRTAAREALASGADDARAAGLLHLASERMTDDTPASPGALQRLLESHPLVMAELLGTSTVLPSDEDDRAITSGPGDGAEQINLGSREVRQLMDAKQWLDGKYHEHMQRINELEKYTAELEAARQWLDTQYHALSAEVRRLSTDAASHAGGNG